MLSKPCARPGHKESRVTKLRVSSPKPTESWWVGTDKEFTERAPANQLRMATVTLNYTPKEQA